MSIRKKLIVSHIAMIVVPAVLFVLVAILLVASDFGQKGSPFGYGETANESSVGPGNWLDGFDFIARFDPKLLTDQAFLAQTAERLAGSDAGIVVETGGRLAFASPFLEQANLLEQVRASQGSEKHGGPPPFQHRVKLGGESYSVKQTVFTAGDGSGDPSVLYVLEDTARYARFFGKFIPILFLVLLLVIGATNGLLSYLVSRSIVRPLYALKGAARQIKEGQLDVPLANLGKDEIGDVGRTFEEMRLRLKDSIETQLHYEDNRKALLANISHDLKTPITAISHCVEGLQAGIADTPEKVEKYYGMIQRKASDMNRMIEELFLFSKLDLRKVPFHLEPIELAGYLQAFVEELDHDPSMQGIQTVLKTGGDSPLYVSADREKLRRALLNIVDNAAKHMAAEPKRIEIELLGGLDEATVSIRDNGPGMDSASLPRIFERFYREDRSRNTDHGGSGLGLAIVEQIVTEHGGRVWADSLPGEGMRISFTLNRTKGPGNYRDENHSDH